MLKNLENPSPFEICFVSSWFDGHEILTRDYPNLPGVAEAAVCAVCQ